MKNKQITLDAIQEEKVIQGITELSESVISTYGPNGHTVIIEPGDKEQDPIVTKDGVTVAKSIQFKDNLKNIAAQFIKKSAEKTATAVGDGTTGATILTSTLIHDGMKYIKNGNNVRKMCDGISLASKHALTELDLIKQNINDKEQTYQIANISANHDHEIGTLIKEALEEVGDDGMVVVEESKTAESKLEIVEGMQFDRGYISPYFVTDNNTMSTTLNNPVILLFDGSISQSKDIVNLLEQCITNDKALLIIAENLEGQALATAIVNKARSSVKVAAVRAPEFGERKTEWLHDIAILTGTSVYSKVKGDKLDKINIDDLGKAKKVTINKRKTTIIDAKTPENAIETRIDELKEQLDVPSISNYEKEKLQERISKLLGGIAVIHIGADTEIEMKEKKFRVEDALHATKAALKEGIVPGGGTALMRIADELETGQYTADMDMDHDTQIGYSLLVNTLRKPFETLITNTLGTNRSEIIWSEVVRTDNSKTYGYDAKQNIITDLFEAGIIDPSMVIRTSLEKSVSSSLMFLNTQTIIVNEEDEDNTSQEQMMF